MRKILTPLIVLLALARLASAQCNTSNPSSITCPNTVTTAQLNTAIAAANDGATFVFAAGVYTGIVGQAKFSPSKGATFICATTPPTGTVSITAWSITSNVVTFTASNSLVAGQTVDITGFPTSTFLNGFPMTVIATGLSGTQFEANLPLAHANGSATESGIGTLTGAAVVNPCQINSAGAVFGGDLFNGTVTKFYRISGFTFDLQGGSPSTGTIYWSSFNSVSKVATLTQVRVDHNTFQHGSTGAQTTLIGDTAATATVYGVYDHNLYTNATQFTTVIYISTDASTLSAGQLGSGNNLFIEDNTLNYVSIGNGSAEGCTDSWSGAALVVRHNISMNCLWASHGETHGGGPSNYEFYNNTGTLIDTVTSGGAFADCTEYLHHQGSGTMMVFNNTCRPASGHTTDAFQVQHYRGGAGTGGNSFSVTGVTLGTPPNITYTGTGLASAPHGWYNFSGFSNAGNNTFTQITSTTATTLVGITTRSLGTQVNESSATATANLSSQDGSAPQCDGTVAPPATVIWAAGGAVGGGDGNRAPVGTNHGYPCFNQPGRDLSGNIMPIYLANNLFTDGTILPGKFAGVGGVIDYASAHLQSQREYFDEVGNTAQTSPTSPFNGTTGTGWGTLANRPTTCTTNTTENAFGHGTSGVGYYATDIGAQGTWYKCTATNTWTSFYTPYTYPHPLVSSPPVAAFTPNPVNTGFVPQNLTGNPVSVTLQNTGGSTLTNTSITLSSNLFTVINNTCGSPATITNSIPGTGFTLAINATCTFQVTASPVVVGPASANLIFVENTALGADFLPLQVTGTGPPAPTTVMSAGQFPTHTMCPVRANMTQLCFAEDCNCWWVSMSGAAYTPFGVSSVNGKSGNVVLSVQ